MATILQMTYRFTCIKIVLFEFLRSMFLGRQILIWTKYGPVYWRTYTPLGLDELKLFDMRYIRCFCTFNDPTMLPLQLSCFARYRVYLYHDDVIKWKRFPRYWPFVRGIRRSPVNSPYKGQWRGALTFSLICAWINACVSNRGAGDLRRNRAHCDVIVMTTWYRQINSIHISTLRLTTS